MGLTETIKGKVNMIHKSGDLLTIEIRIKEDVSIDLKRGTKVEMLIKKVK